MRGTVSLIVALIAVRLAGSGVVNAAPADATPEPATPAQASLPVPGGPRALSSDPLHCGLLIPGFETTPSRTCLTCHTRMSHGGHPFDVPYPRLGGGHGDRALRPLAEVARRGIVLVEQQVGCVACHDGRSPWRYRIKLPPGTRPTPGVDLARRVSYERPETLPPPQRGDDVAKKALCLACHALD